MKTLRILAGGLAVASVIGMANDTAHAAWQYPGGSACAATSLTQDGTIPNVSTIAGLRDWANNNCAVAAGLRYNCGAGVQWANSGNWKDKWSGTSVGNWNIGACTYVGPGHYTRIWV